MPVSTHDRQELRAGLERFLAATESPTAHAARHGVSHETIRRRMERGEIEAIHVGRDIRVWRDA